MSITVLPTQAPGSLGQVKSDAFPATDLSNQVPASEHNTAMKAVEDIAAEVGLTDGTTAGSLRKALTLQIKTKITSYTLDLVEDAGTWHDEDTDTAGGDITVTVPTGLNPGDVIEFSKLGTGGDVLFLAGGGMTLRGALTLSLEDGVAAVLILTSTTALVMGSVA